MNSSKLLLQPQLCGRVLTYTGRRDKPEPCRKFVRVSHCIFDLDGAILDNHTVLDNAYKTVFEKYGREYTREWGLKIMGMSEHALWEKVAKDLVVRGNWKDMLNDYRKVTEGSLLDAPLRPGLERLVDHLDKHKVPMAIVSSSPKAVTEVKTRHIQEIISKFQHVTCCDDPNAKKSKPSGQIFLICAAYFLGKPEPETCLVFEDTPIGVTAATDACMQVIGIQCPPTPHRALRHAYEVLSTFHEFQPGKYGLPKFPGEVPQVEK